LEVNVPNSLDDGFVYRVGRLEFLDEDFLDV
jgi:hypothetical protein